MLRGFIGSKRRLPAPRPTCRASISTFVSSFISDNGVSRSTEAKAKAAK